MPVVSPYVIVVGGGVMAGVLDIITQFIELKVKRSAAYQREALAAEWDDDAMSATSYPATEVALSVRDWNAPRSGRMLVVGMIQGVLSVSILTGIQNLIGDDQGWLPSLEKSTMRLLLQPLFFTVSTALIESMRELNCRTVLPKLRQDFRSAMFVAALVFPMQIIVYHLASNVVDQILLFMIPDMLTTIAMNVLLNRALKPHRPHATTSPLGGEAEDSPAEGVPANTDLTKERSEPFSPSPGSMVSFGHAKVVG